MADSCGDSANCIRRFDCDETETREARYLRLTLTNQAPPAADGEFYLPDSETFCGFFILETDQICKEASDCTDSNIPCFPIESWTDDHSRIYPQLTLDLANESPGDALQVTWPVYRTFDFCSSLSYTTVLDNSCSTSQNLLCPSEDRSKWTGQVPSVDLFLTRTLTFTVILKLSDPGIARKTFQFNVDIQNPCESTTFFTPTL